jgi:hypothetical protein
MNAEPIEQEPIALLTHEQILDELEQARIDDEPHTRRRNAFHAQMGRAAGRKPLRLVHSRDYDVQGEGEV